MNYFEIHTLALPENELVIRTALVAFLLPLNPTNDEMLEIKTICQEAVVNAIVHAYPQDKGSLIVKMSYSIRTVTICVMDQGVGIASIDNVRNMFYTTKEKEEHCGMGFTIMETFSDDMQIESHVNQGTTVTLVRTIHGIQ